MYDFNEKLRFPVFLPIPCTSHWQTKSQIGKPLKYHFTTYNLVVSKFFFIHLYIKNGILILRNNCIIACSTFNFPSHILGRYRPRVEQFTWLSINEAIPSIQRDWLTISYKTYPVVSFVLVRMNVRTNKE